MTDLEALAARVEGAMPKPCGMCFGTGVTPRYRGPTRAGPCMACNGLRLRNLSEQESGR